MAAILKLWRQIENPTSLVDADAYLLEEPSCEVSSRSDLKRQMLFEEVSQQEEQEEE